MLITYLAHPVGYVGCTSITVTGVSSFLSFFFTLVYGGNLQ